VHEQRRGAWQQIEMPAPLRGGARTAEQSDKNVPMIRIRDRSHISSRAVGVNYRRLGTVAFKDGSRTLGLGSLNGGKVTFSTAALSKGTHTIQASYYGNTSFNPHLSAGVTLTIQ
jgi:Bacterial Ig-like domain (group 3)